ncbi:MAG: hypothetical protein QOG45_1652 [Chloroflexota bacterium]|nr:hypothetical protein [Chloroflexota bacterium]
MADDDAFSSSPLLKGAFGAVRRLVGAGSPSEVEGQRFFSRAAGATETVEVGGGSVQLPIHYRRADILTAFFTAGRDAVERLLPDGLHPVNMGRDRTQLAISGANYLDSTLGPYGEVAITVPCTHGRRAPAIVSAALQTLFPGFGYFVIHLPVTTPLADELGRSVWGYPKFLADIDFDRTPGHQRVRLAEGGAEILSLSVPQRGLPVRDDRPWVFYATRDTDLLRVTTPCRSIYQVLPGGPGVRLQLGDHRIAAQLRRLRLSTRPLFSLNYLYYASVLPAGEIVDEVDRPYLGYRPGERDLVGRVGAETPITGEPAPGQAPVIWK